MAIVWNKGLSSRIAHTLFEDTEGTELATVINVPVSREYTDTTAIAQIRAVLQMMAPAKQIAIIMIFLGFFMVLAMATVSITHVWEIIASISPQAPLELSSRVLHSSALAFTIVSDAAYIYLVLVAILATFAGVSKPNTMPLLFLLGVLNALYIVKYFPNLTPTFSRVAVATLSYLSVILLPVVFMVTLIKLKAAIEYCITAYLVLSVKQTTLKEVLDNAVQSLRTEQEQERTLDSVSRTIQNLHKQGFSATKIAKTLGGNYQNRLVQVKNTLEQLGG